MYPNQQPPQNQQNGNQQQPSYGPPQGPAQPPQPLPGYGPQPQPTYEIDYLDQIAPPPARSAFLSGSFGKIVIGLGVVFVFAVSIIIALGGQKGTAPLEAVTVKVENIGRIASDQHRYIKSNSLSNTNTNYQLWLTNTARDGGSLLGRAGVKKSQYDNKMVAALKTESTELTETLTDARLNGAFDRKYASEMAYQTGKMANQLNAIAKNPPGPPFKEFATTAVENLKPIQKAFEDYGKTTED